MLMCQGNYNNTSLQIAMISKALIYRTKILHYKHKLKCNQVTYDGCCSHPLNLKGLPKTLLVFGRGYGQVLLCDAISGVFVLCL